VVVDVIDVVDVVDELVEEVDEDDVDVETDWSVSIVVDVAMASGGGESSTFMSTTTRMIRPTTTPAPTSTLDWVTCLSP
jgi:hypothetical protein